MMAPRMRSIIPFSLLLALVALSATVPGRAVREAGLRQAIFQAEHSRAPDAAALAVLTGALKSPEAGTRRAAVRALGRLERPECGRAMAPLLADPDPSVRAEAADALGQSLHAAAAPRPGSSAADPGAAFVLAARDLLLARLDVETEAAARGALAATIGRLPYRDPAAIAAAEKAILSSLGPEGALEQPALPALLGAARGAESLLRLQARTTTPGAGLIERLKALLPTRPGQAWNPANVESAAAVRRLALAALTAANRADEEALESAAADPDDQVRRLVLAGFGGRAPSAVPMPVVERLVRRGLRDPAGMVRREALRVYGRLFLGSDPEPVLASIHDDWPHAALLAVDLAGQAPVAAKDKASSLLESLARSLPPGGKPIDGLPASRTWHGAARAIVSLARLAPESARPLLRSFESSPDWPIRMYAARAAALLKDEASLRRLAGDPRDNVREAALAGLAGLVGRAADPLFAAALSRSDYQLIQTAARALKGTKAAGLAVPALLDSLDRLTAEKRDTSRDPRLAVLERIGELAAPADAGRLTPYLKDFDPAVVAAAAPIIERLTGRKPEISPQPLPLVRAAWAEVERLRNSTARLTMADGAVIELELLADEAPASAARFARLAGSGYYNGLTIHRIDPNFVIQGGSPGANEYMGDGAFMRDEVGPLSHARGTLGISTRGRDTGDAQFFLNLVDNPRLDHDYTVFARVVSGLPAADRILECTVIAKVEIVPRPGRSAGAPIPAQRVAADAGVLTPVGLRCQGAENPLGIDIAKPSLSWRLEGQGWDLRQTAYRIQAATQPELLRAGRPDLWDSFRVDSDETIGIVYKGTSPLGSYERVYWRVLSYDRDSRPTPWSETASWTMGVLRPDDWRAAWIGRAPETGPPAATLLLRRELVVKAPLRRAELVLCGLGFHEASINGRRIGQDYFSPGWTKYDKSCLYDTYDVTASLRPGPNAVAVLLGNGFYNVTGGRYIKYRGSFGPLKAIVQLRLEYEDRSFEFVGSDAAWRAAPGPITFSCVYGGEDYDARRVRPGFDRPGFDDAEWAPAAVVSGPGGVLRGSAEAAPPIRIIESLRPGPARTLRPGVEVYDLGQNASLMPRLAVRGPAGSRVRVIPAELLREDGSVDRGSAGSGEAYWQYTLAGTGDEAYTPRFFYSGARYLQIERSPASAGEPLPEVASLEGLVVHTSAAPAGEFACSSDLFNRIRTLIRWAQRSNLMSVVTDCPHREKLGWLEQYHLNGPSLRYEWTLDRLFTKTMNDMADSQLADGLVPDIAPEYTVFDAGFRDSPEWGSAFVIVPWQQYEWTGDTGLLRRHYEGMRRYVEYLAAKAEAGILSHGLGDWYDLGPKPPGEAQLTPKALTATAFYYWDLRIMGRAAAVLDRKSEAKAWDHRAEEVKSAFNARFFDSSSGLYASGSQTAQSLALVMGLVPPGREAVVLEALVKDVRSRGDALTAGDVGFRYLLRALADGGRSDVVFDMNSRSDKPGYGFQLRAGATSLTEAWDAGRASSQNHFMLGHIIEWFYRDLAGIGPDPEGPGFKRIRFRPQPVGGLTWARAAVETVRGRVESEWKQEGDRFLLNVTVPPNTSAAVEWPDRAVGPVLESGQPAAKSPGVLGLATGAGRTIIRLGSGRYAFESQWR